jgi:hypothetical protein
VLAVSMLKLNHYQQTTCLAAVRGDERKVAVGVAHYLGPVLVRVLRGIRGNINDLGGTSVAGNRACKLLKTLPSSWRRGAGSNRRIKVLQYFTFTAKSLFLQQLAFRLVRLLSDLFAAFLETVSICLIGLRLDFVKCRHPHMSAFAGSADAVAGAFQMPE